MDGIDRQIIFDLYNNCRIPYQELAEKHGLTVSAIWRRVQQLQKDGIIDHFAIEISPNKIQIYQMLIIMSVDGVVDEQALVNHLSEIDYITSISSITNRTGIMLLEGPDPELLSLSAKVVESTSGVSSIDVYRIGTWSEAWEGGNGDKPGLPSFTPDQIEVLRILYQDPRVSLSELRKKLDWSHRRVKRILEEIVSGDAIFFTIRVSLRGLTVIFKIVYNTDTNQERIIQWLHKSHPNKYMFTFTDTDRRTGFSHVTVESFDEADIIRSEIKDLEGVESVETLVQRPSIKLQRFRGKLLEKILTRELAD